MGRGSDKHVFTTQTEYATCTFPLMHPICPPNFGQLNLCVSFLLGITAVPREIESNTYGKISGGQKRGIMGDVQVTYTNFLRGWYSSPTSDNPHQQV